MSTPSSVRDSDTPPSDDTADHRDTLAARAEEAEAEADAAEALAAAAVARARAVRLRTAAAHGPDDAADVDGDPDSLSDGTDDSDVAPAAPTPPRRRRRPRRSTVLVGLVVFCAAGFLAASAFMVLHHRDALREQQRTAEYTAAARQVVYTLMSIDADKATENVRQILDSTTGQFREEFEGAQQDFVQLAQDGKVVTDVDVKAAAVESVADDSAIVLVTASSTVTNAAGADKQPRTWRLRVDMVRDADRLKMSKMEFVP